MRQTLLALFIFLLLGSGMAQSRLEPADSSRTDKWYQERPTDLILSSTFGPSTSILLHYSGMNSFLEDQGIDMQRPVNVYSFGLQFRIRRLMLALNGYTSVSINDDELTTNNRRFFMDQDFSAVDVSVGYIAFTNRFMTIIPSLGVGGMLHSVQYTFENTDAAFDFDNPTSFQSNGSPNLQHESPHFLIKLEFVNGFQSNKRIHGIYGFSIGYQRGIGTRAWEAIPGRVSNSFEDRAGLLLLNAMIGIAIGPRK